MSGYFPLNEPGVPLILFDGQLRRTIAGQEISAPGRVTLTWRTERASLLWTVDLDTVSDETSYMAWRYRPGQDSAQIAIDFADLRSAHLDVRLNGEGKGWIPGSTLGDDTAQLDHLIAHWINLPMILPASGLHEHHRDGGSTTWGGRWQTSFAGWALTIDARPDHPRVYERAREEESFVITHVMDLRRNDGTAFPGAEAADVLTGLQYALSFAVGHWTSPALPVGYDASGVIRWSQWHPLHTGRPRRGAGWWADTRSEDLEAFVASYFDHWTDLSKREPLRFATTAAILAVETGFVEQRLQTAYSALEMLSWVTEVLEGGMAEHKWSSEKADWRLRRLLSAAEVDSDIRRENDSILAQFARSEQLGDTAAALTQVRHRLTHPRNPTDLYRTRGLVAEASRLACRYLELMILHRIGYQGHVADRTKLGRWVGETDPAPWVRRNPDSEG